MSSGCEDRTESVEQGQGTDFPTSATTSTVRLRACVVVLSSSYNKVPIKGAGPGGFTPGSAGVGSSGGRPNQLPELPSTGSTHLEVGNEVQGEAA
jgi:hypothetical protein